MDSMVYVASFIDAISTRRDDFNCHKFRCWAVHGIASIHHILCVETLSNVCGRRGGGDTVRVHDNHRERIWGSRRGRALCRE